MKITEILCVLSVILVECSNSFRIGAFNLKIFGRTKAANTKVLNYIVKIIQRYDIILLQEIRNQNGEAIRKLEDALNKGTNIQYGQVISERLGNTVSKEQYLFFYRKDRDITILESYVYTDPQNVFEREPLIVKFRVSNTVASEFVLVGIHVKPTEAIKEIAALENVRYDIHSKMRSDNILFLGDMNAECSYAPKKHLNKIPIRNSPDYHWLIGDDVDTTVSKGTDCAYDRFIVYGDKFLAAVEKGSNGVFFFDKEFGLTNDEAMSVSDHYPIELELRTVTSSAPTIPYTMFASVCIGSVICSCFYCLRG